MKNFVNSLPTMYAVKLLLLLVYSIAITNSIKLASLDKTYVKGVQAYTKERWSECIVQFEESLHLYKLYKTIVVNCRLKCRSHNFKPSSNENLEDLHVFEMFFNMKNCLTSCKNHSFEDLRLNSTVSSDVLENLQARRPYEYLHMCYFQMYSLPKAASAAYTYFVANPHEEAMKANVQYYIQQPEVDPNEVIDLESDDYKTLSQLGVKAYKQNKWGETVAYLEEALIAYLAWENNCRAECEGLPEQEWSPEFTNTVSNYMASLLLCKQRCQDELKPLHDTGVLFLGDVLNYLQISYFHLDKLEDAAKTVSSYLILMPTDEDMLHNKEIYETIADKDAFKARSDIVYYWKRDMYEKKLLKFFLKGSDNTDNKNTIKVL